MSQEWRKRGDYEWWLVFKDAPESLRSEDGTRWPPSMTISWTGPGGCCHLNGYYNGAAPGEADEDDVDYLHICNVDDLIAELRAFKEAAGWQPAEWERAEQGEVSTMGNIEQSEAIGRAEHEALIDKAVGVIEARERDMYEAMRERDEAREQLRGAVEALEQITSLEHDVAARRRVTLAWIITRAKDALATTHAGQ